MMIFEEKYTAYAILKPLFAPQVDPAAVVSSVLEANEAVEASEEAAVDGKSNIGLATLGNYSLPSTCSSGGPCSFIFISTLCFMVCILALECWSSTRFQMTFLPFPLPSHTYVAPSEVQPWSSFVRHTKNNFLGHLRGT